MIKVTTIFAKFKGQGSYLEGDEIDLTPENEKALVDGGFAEYVTNEPQTEKEDKTKKTTKEDKLKLQTKELKFEGATFVG